MMDWMNKEDGKWQRKISSVVPKKIISMTDGYREMYDG